jgi:hypothetical protein
MSLHMWREKIIFFFLSVESLGLEDLLPSRSKVQHLMGANNPLGPHPLVKSQRLN